MNYNTKQAKGGKFPRDLSRRAHLQSQTLRTQEWEDLPTVAALAVLKRHADVWAQAVAAGEPVAPMRAAHASMQDGQPLVISATRNIVPEPGGARVTHVVTYRSTDRAKATKESTHARLERQAA
jgi:hypothetical protein